MFMLVSVRHVGALPGEHQHGVSIPPGGGGALPYETDGDARRLA